MSVMINNWGDLTPVLDAFGENIAAFIEARECCMANAMLGLGPETGEPVDNVNVPDAGTSTDPDTGEEVVAEEEVVIEEPCDPIGNPLTDVSGNAVTCPAYLPSEGRKQTYVTHKTEFGNDIWCLPGFMWALAVTPGTAPDPTLDYSFLNDDPPTNGALTAEVNGAPFACPDDYELPAAIVGNYEGQVGYPYIVHCCEEIPLDPLAGGGTSSDKCSGFTGNTQSSYYKMWQDYLCCYNRYQKWYVGLYGFQLVAGLAAAVQGILCYNDILDENKKYAKNLTDNSEDLRRCVVDMLGDGTEENPGVLKDCQNQLLAGHVERIGTINGQNAFVCNSAETMWDCYTETFQPLEKQYASQYAEKLFGLVCTGEDSADALEDNAAMLNQLIEEHLTPKIEQLFPDILCSVQCPADNLNEWRRRVQEKTHRLDAHYRCTYENGETTMIPQIMNMVECMICRVCEARDLIMNCAQRDDTIYTEYYQSQEGCQANEWMSKSATMAGKMYEAVCWLDTNIPAMLTLFDGIEKGFDPIQKQLFQNADQLAPEIVACFEFFDSNADEYKAQWENCYKDPECDFVVTFFESIKGLTHGYAKLTKAVPVWSAADRARYERYAEIESEVTPQVVRNGAEANDKSFSFLQWWQEKSGEFYDTWKDSWWECELAEKQKWEEMWNLTKPIDRLVDNASDMKQLSTSTLVTLQKGLNLTEKEVEKLEDDPEYFDYCIESLATAHVKRQNSFDQENIIRCASRFAPGATEETLIRLKSAQSRAEGAVIALTERWKWQANLYLDDRQFARKTALIGLASSAGQTAIAASQASSADYSMLLTKQREVYSLGQAYLGRSESMADRTLGGYGQLTANMERMLGVWQFSAGLALQENQQATATTQQAITDAQAIIGRGQQWTAAARDEKSMAKDVINDSIANAFQLMQLGQFYFQQADSMNSQKAGLATTVGELGTRYAGLGHDLNKAAAAKREGVMTEGIEAANTGARTAEAGHALMLGALKEENVTTLNGLRHLELGVSAINTALDFIEESTQTLQQSYQLSNSASTNMLQLFKHGQAAFALSTAASEACYKQEFDMLCKAKEYAQKNYQLHQAALTRGTTGEVLGDIRGELNNAIAGGLGTFGNAAQNLISLNAPTPPIPTGTGAFPSGTGNGFGGLNFG